MDFDKALSKIIQEREENVSKKIEEKTGLSAENGAKWLKEHDEPLIKLIEQMGREQNIQKEDVAKLTRTLDKTMSLLIKVAEAKRDKENPAVSKIGGVECECGVVVDLYKTRECPGCGNVYENGHWTSNENYIESDEIGKALCQRCHKSSDWNEVKITGSSWWGGKRKDCPNCGETAFIKTAKGWLAMTDEVKKAKEDDDSWWGLGFDLEDIIDRYEKEYEKRSGGKAKKKEKGESTFDI